MLRTKARNGNYRDIVRGIKIDPHGMDLLTGYHHVFWVGDLNYRLDWGSQATNPTESPSQADFDEIVAKVGSRMGISMMLLMRISTDSYWCFSFSIPSQVDQGSYQELLKTDQLHKEMAAKRAFLGFTEVSAEGGILPPLIPQVLTAVNTALHN